MRRFKTKKELKATESIRFDTNFGQARVYQRDSGVFLGVLKCSEYGKDLSEIDEQSFCNRKFLDLVTVEKPE
jgi:hypothetical protein